MENIYEANAKFPFNQLTIISPTSVSGGAHFSKLLMNKQPLYIQTPKCKTKQGIVKSGKKMYADLVFTHEDEEFIQWLETLETTVRKMIYDNRTKWFDVELTEEDVENYFTPTIKLYKSGKMYLVRVNANSKTSGSIMVSNMKIYNENEQTVEIDAIDDKTSMITIVEVQGVKCSSKSFQIDIEIKQIMVLKQVDLFQKCIIKTAIESLPESTIVDLGNIVVKKNEATIEMLVEPLEENKELIVIEMKSDNVPLNTITSIQVEPVVPQTLEPIDNFLGADVSEVNFDLIDLEESDTFHLKEKTEVYYEMYREARRKAKLAKSLALSSFMEARRIKNLYMLDDVDDSDSDLEDLDESLV